MGALGPTTRRRRTRMTRPNRCRTVIILTALLAGTPALISRAADGNLDPSFGTAGRTVTNFGNTAQANAVVLQGGGRVVAVGSAFVGSTLRVALVRHLPNGSLDPAFGTGGIVTTEVVPGTNAGGQAAL